MSYPLQEPELAIGATGDEGYYVPPTKGTSQIQVCRGDGLSCTFVQVFSKFECLTSVSIILILFLDKSSQERKREEKRVTLWSIDRTELRYTIL